VLETCDKRCPTASNIHWHYFLAIIYFQDDLYTPIHKKELINSHLEDTPEACHFNCNQEEMQQPFFFELIACNKIPHKSEPMQLLELVFMGHCCLFPLMHFSIFFIFERNIYKLIKSQFLFLLAEDFHCFIVSKKFKKCISSAVIGHF
jgi:hypothetical protein